MTKLQRIGVYMGTIGFCVGMLTMCALLAMDLIAMTGMHL